MIRLMLALLTLFATQACLIGMDDQRANMQATAESLGLRSSVMVETDDLVLLATLPETKLKPIATQAQKAVSTAVRVLKLPDGERPFSGRLAVYVFTDAADLRKFVRQVEKRRPDAKEFTLRATGDTPYLAVGPQAGATATDYSEIAAGWAAATLLARQAGADRRPPPEWLLAGFGRACHAQSLPAERRKAARTLVRNTLAKSQTPVWAYAIWKDEALLQRDLITASVVEFLAFGPTADKFPTFAKALAPLIEDDGDPSVDEALKLLELTPETLDQSWKSWLQQAR